MRPTVPNAIELTMEPEGPAWGDLLGHNASERAKTFRGELGLPTDRPVIMSGHQAQIWHPGILSKYLSMNAACEALGAHPAWLVVDQDTGEPLRLRYARENGAAQRRAGEANLGLDQQSPEDAPVGLRPASRITPGVPGELARIGEALRAHEGAGSLSEQVQSAGEDLLKSISEPAPRVCALAISQTSLFAELAGRMSADPDKCRVAYNEAAGSVPNAGVRPLRAGDDQTGVELPLWVIGDGVRRPAYARDLGTHAPEELAPRALSMTGLVRLAGCDLFIHGLGGGVYDRVTDRWLASWLGEDSTAPSVVVSASLRLGGDADLTAVDEADRLAWRAHAAKHNPALLGDSEAAAEKSRLLAELRGARPDRATVLFREMHGLLRGYRESHENELGGLDRKASEARERAGGARRDAEIARDRTLAFPLYPERDLIALRERVRDAFALSR